MKGYVNVTIDQLREAIAGFELKFAQGKRIRDKGIELYYIKNFVGGSWLTRFFSRKCTPMQFARKNCSFGSWDSLLYTVLTTEESELLSWWCWTVQSEVNPLKSLLSQSSDGFALVDDKMAVRIESWREYK